MAVNYRASLKTSRMQAVLADIDSGAGPGTLEIGTVGMAAVLVSIPLADPSGAVAGDTLTFAGMPREANAGATGAAAAARIKESGGAVVVDGLTVGGTAEGTAAGKNIVLTTTAVNAGQPVRITSLSLQHA